MTTKEVPAEGEFLAQYQRMVTDARGQGKPLSPTPALMIDPSKPPWFGRAHFLPWERPTRIVVSPTIAELPSEERAWTLAHELSHHVRYRAGRMAAFLALQATMMVGFLAALLVAVIRWTPRPPAPDPQLAISVASIVVVVFAYLMLLRPTLQRRDEAAADHTAAALFGEIATVDEVIRLQEEEVGNKPRWLRTHPDPAARRAAGQVVLGTVAGQPHPTRTDNDNPG